MAETVMIPQYRIDELAITMYDETNFDLNDYDEDEYACHVRFRELAEGVSRHV